MALINEIEKAMLAMRTLEAIPKTIGLKKECAERLVEEYLAEKGISLKCTIVDALSESDNRVIFTIREGW